MAYHYQESGLDNVYLENGVNFIETPYGEGVSIKSTDNLHKAIGTFLIDAPRPLNGAELRFMRIELDLSQRSLAALLGTSEQTLRLWEKARDKALPGSPDRLLRGLYREFIGLKGSMRESVERLADLNQIEPTSICLREEAGEWRVLVPCYA